MTRAWHSAPNGRITQACMSSPFISTHVVSLVGYEDASSTVKFVNSWGPKWGDAGTGTVTYDFFDTNLVECWGGFRDSSGPLAVEDLTMLKCCSNRACFRPHLATSVSRRCDVL